MSHRDEPKKRKSSWHQNGNNGKRRPPPVDGKRKARWSSRWDDQRPSSSRHPNCDSQWRRHSHDRYHYKNVNHSGPHKNDPTNNDFSHNAPLDYADDNIVYLEAEKNDKILATKKRLEEALASSKSLNVTSDIQKYNNDITTLKVPELNKPLSLNAVHLVETQDFKLTNSDFTEIGSVDPISSRSVVGEVEGGSDEVLVDFALGSSQQRSFDNNYTAPSQKSPTVSKSPRLGGWSIDKLNEATLMDNVKLGTQREEARQVENGRKRVRGEMYIQESTETILGPTLRQISQVDRVDPSKTKPHSSPKQQWSQFSRVGKLYQSFLKSRLSGYTPKIKGSTQRPVETNPLLDTSAIHSGRKTPLIELEMPKVQVKSETNDAMEDLSTAKEANEFCQEFGFLLSGYNLLIPQDNLEKLGLGHLSEMNNMIDSSITNPANGNLGIADIISEISDDDFPMTNEKNETRGGHPLMSRLKTNSATNSEKLDIRQENLVNSGFVEQSDPPTTFTCNNLGGTDNNISVESIVKTVIESITKSSGCNSQLPIDGCKTQCSSVEKLLSSATTNSSNSTTVNKIEDISKKILDLFVIDKQIQELMEQKNKIYSELFSSKDISFTLFNNWANDRIIQGRVLNNSSTTTSGPKSVYENRELNPSQTETSEASYFQDKILYETMSELQSLKQEIKVLKGSPSSNLFDNNFESLVSAEKQIPNRLENDIPIQEKPKLSVRKDLVDPSVLQIPNSLNPNESQDSSDFSEAESELNLPNDRLDKRPKSPQQVVKNTNNKSKGSDKSSVEIIDLIDQDSSDEEGPCDSSVAESDALASEMGQQIESGAIVVKQPTASKIKQAELKFDLRKNTATCITTLKQAIIVGCQEGFLMVFALRNGNNVILQQIHEGAILSIYAITEQRCVITGSADSTICLFSLEDKVIKQQIKIRSPIQCMDVNFKKMFIGTNNGFLFTCRIKIASQSKSADDVKLVLKDDGLQVSHSNILALKAAKEGVRKVIIVASRGENITVRDTNTGLLLRMFDWIDTVYCLETYNETPLVFCGTSSQSVRIVNFTTGENAQDCLLGRSIIQIGFLDTILFAASFDGKIYIYDIQEKRLIHIMNVFKNNCLITSLKVMKTKILVANNKDDVQALPFPADLKSHIRKKKKISVCES